jgi:hypothetical protein
MNRPTPQVTGFIGWRYHGASGTSKHGPTLDKPQTKFWRANGSWWAVLANSEDDVEGLSVYQFDEHAEAFTKASETLTNKPCASVDAHFDGKELLLAIRAPEVGIELQRLHYDDDMQRYLPDPDGSWTEPEVESPSVSVTKSKVGSIVLTYATDLPYYLSSPQSSFPHLGTSAALPGATPTLIGVDLSAVIALGDDVALLWSDQGRESFFCAILREDGTVDIEIAVSGGLVADDHIAVREYQGRLFVAVKTSRDDDPARASDDSLLLLLVREPTGKWHHHCVAKIHEPVTRPMPLLEPEAGLIHVLYTHGPNPGERTIRARSARLDQFEFAAQETTVMAVSNGQLNDVTGSREPLTRHNGALVAASDGHASRYHFAHLHAGFSIPRGPSI